MAATAFLRGLDMVAGFANRLHPVVTTGATAAVFAVVELADCPLPGGVATVAVFLSANVVSRQAGGSNRIVAAEAVFRRSFELAVGVATLAAHRRVRPGQRKPGLEVIKI